MCECLWVCVYVVCMVDVRACLFYLVSSHETGNQIVSYIFSIFHLEMTVYLKVLDIKLSTNPDKCPNDVRTQFWRQCARMRSVHWHTVLAPTLAHARRALWHGGSKRNRLARSSTDTHVSWRGDRY